MEELKTYLYKYTYADIAKRDILGVFSQYKDLRPTLTFNDDLQKQLVSLDGTIPVNYRGSVYNIPVRIFLLDTHPYNPPIVYVQPTNTMEIKQGPNVHANGKVHLPFLRDWRYPQSDLLGLIQILVIAFSEEPPVFSKTQSSQNRPPYEGSQPQYHSLGAGLYSQDNDKLQHPAHSEVLIDLLQEENSFLKRKITCKSCLAKYVSIAFLPCEHLAVCTDCATEMSKCPVCSAVIRSKVRICLQ